MQVGSAHTHIKNLWEYHNSPGRKRSERWISLPYPVLARGWSILKDVLTRALWGTVIGVSLALASAPRFRSLLYGVSATDAATFAITLAGVITLNCIAGYIPARRSACADPVVALKTDWRPYHALVNPPVRVCRIPEELSRGSIRGKE